MTNTVLENLAATNADAEIWWDSSPVIFPSWAKETLAKAPAGKEKNWVQTIPGKGWNTLLRLYGPLQPWFDKTWRPGEIEPL